MTKLLLALILVVLFGCAPRGEHKTIDELLTKAKSRYSSNFTNDNPNASNLKSVSKNMEALISASGSDQKHNAQLVADTLSELNKSAGYTSRPAMSELVLQYQALARKQAKDNASVKLLVSRTYNLLASELEGTAFKL